MQSPGQILTEKHRTLVEEVVLAINDFFRHSQRGLYTLMDEVETNNDLITAIEFDPKDGLTAVGNDYKYRLEQFNIDVLLSLLSELESAKPEMSKLA